MTDAELDNPNYIGRDVTNSRFVKTDLATGAAERHLSQSYITSKIIFN